MQIRTGKMYNFSICIFIINFFQSSYSLISSELPKNISTRSINIKNPFLSNFSEISFISLPINDSELKITQQLPRYSEKEDRIKETSISEKKCKQFSSTISPFQLAYHPTGTENLTKIIIRHSPNDSKWQLDSTPLVSGGTEAHVNEFPHLAALGSLSKDGQFIFNCAGTLIDTTWILTAAHCTTLSWTKLTTVKLGIHRLSQQNTGTTVGIVRILRHPSYKPPEMYYDLALVQIDVPVDFSGSIRPACLDQDFGGGPNDAWICGWGSVEFAGAASDVLQKAQVSVIDNIWCSSRYSTSSSIPRGIVPSMMCAGSPADHWKRDTCQGDSGGPLQVRLDGSLLFKVVGITSFGAGCGLVNYPGVYTRVSHFIQWIEDIVWP